MLKATPEWHMGRRGEILQLAVLSRFGFSLIDIGGSTDKRAPLLHKYQASLVSPDAMAFKASGPLWLEFKTKSHHTKWRGGSPSDSPKTSPRTEEGIDRKNYLAYLQVQQTSKVPVVLLVLSIAEGELLGNSLRGLGEPRISPNASFDLVSWDVSKFRRLCVFNYKNLRKYFYHSDGSIRDYPADVPSEEQRRQVLDFLQPEQGELDLLILDLISQFEAEWHRGGI